MSLIKKIVDITSAVEVLKISESKINSLEKMSIIRKEENHFSFEASFIDDDLFPELLGELKEADEDIGEQVIGISDKVEGKSEAKSNNNDNSPSSSEKKPPPSIPAKLQLKLESYYQVNSEGLCQILWREADFVKSKIKVKIRNEEIRFQVLHLLLEDAKPVLEGEIQFDQQGNTRFYIDGFIENDPLIPGIIDPCSNCPASKLWKLK